MKVNEDRLIGMVIGHTALIADAIVVGFPPEWCQRLFLVSGANLLRAALAAGYSEEDAVKRIQEIADSMTFPPENADKIKRCLADAHREQDWFATKNVLQHEEAR